MGKFQLSPLLIASRYKLLRHIQSSALDCIAGKSTSSEIQICQSTESLPIVPLEEVFTNTIPVILYKPFVFGNAFKRMCAGLPFKAGNPMT